jgi:peptide-methionine (R)-S-oxide reductase
MYRIEIRCARCGCCHLGHVLDDGSPPTGEHHCLNSVSISFVDKASR